jgi:Domain of unknown function (DUF4382)/Carboxypeptidase regulatory-like domain
MKKLLLTLLAVSMLLAGCRKSDNNEGQGSLSVKITDDPFNISYVESASVTITKVELRKAGDITGNPFIVLSEDSVTIDLLKLRNGITEDLVNLNIPAGDYDLVRLYIDRASLKIKGQPDMYHVKVPGGSQTGIKIFLGPALNVAGGLTAELLLDFDLSRSFVMRGNMQHSAGVNGFIFKPCIRAANNSTAGRIEGFVTDSSFLKIVNARVSLMKDTVVATSFTDTLGHYAFIGVPSGQYSMSAAMDLYDSVSVGGVNVLAANRTIQNFILTRK